MRDLIQNDIEVSYSFEIQDSRDLFLEFLRRYDEYQNDVMSSGNAVVCAILAWHVVDWIYEEFPSVTGSFKKKSDFQKASKAKCLSLEYIQDIANGTKHKGIDMYKPSVKNTDAKEGSFSEFFSGFSHESFDKSGLRMTLDDGSEVYFDEEIFNIKEFLHNYFTNTLGVNIQQRK